MAAEQYEIEYAEEAVDDVKLLRRFDQTKVLEAIDTHLRHEPTKTSRARIEQMVQPFWSEYRLRVDDFRVYHDVDKKKPIVSILRILEKGRNETMKEPEHETD